MILMAYMNGIMSITCFKDKLSNSLGARGYNALHLENRSRKVVIWYSMNTFRMLIYVSFSIQTSPLLLSLYMHSKSTYHELNPTKGVPKHILVGFEI